VRFTHVPRCFLGLITSITLGDYVDFTSLLGIGLVIIIGLIVVWIVIRYTNRVKILANRIDAAWAQIDVQLKKRYDLVPNLVATVKGYAAHEREIFENVAKARERMVSGAPEERIAGSNALTGALRSLFAIAENYPQLRASENFTRLQDELSSIESQIASARQRYNRDVLAYNNLVTTIPGRWFAGGQAPRPFLEVPDTERGPVTVSF
jgi:LemA protein